MPCEESEGPAEVNHQEEADTPFAKCFPVFPVVSCFVRYVSIDKEVFKIIYTIRVPGVYRALYSFLISFVFFC